MYYYLRTLGKDIEVSRDQFMAVYDSCDNLEFRQSSGNYHLIDTQECVCYTVSGADPD